MKRVVSVSLGSSRRDHQAVANFGGQDFLIERIGTDGDKKKAIQLIKQLDGTVDAFGMGGTDLYVYAGNKRYTFSESAEIAAAAQKTPIVDGSGIKNTLERRVVQYLAREGGITFKNKPVLVVCAVDRFGLAEELVAAGSKTVFGDLLFGLGLPIPISSLNYLAMLARVIAPIITKLPVSLFYPTGDNQVKTTPRFSQYFKEAEIIAGDFHFIRRYMPERLDGKLIITNTVTQKDEKLLQDRGVATLITTTPEIGGRSFGTNVLEGVLVALSGKRPEELTVVDYGHILDQINIMPRIKRLS
ncbi:quinate 5-dehydrogenase [Pelosinus sp. sgz500959]|uniref:quinate 5-dehydrogenase n=1 Tax=Pelosinus sp. sgz500959 TaxID=3242472 RepID=UPI0036721ECD